MNSCHQNYYMLVVNSEHWPSIISSGISMLCFRISAKTTDGRLIWNHTEGDPFFFTFGNSEVSMSWGQLLIGKFQSEYHLSSCSSWNRCLICNCVMTVA